MIIFIYDYFYYNNKSDIWKYNAPVLAWEARDIDGNPHLIRIQDKEFLAPMFGILHSEYEEMLNNVLIPESVVEWTEDVPDTPYGEKTARLYTTFPWEVGKLKRGEDLFSRTFYADVKWEKMAMSKIIKILDLEGPFVEVPDDYGSRFLEVSDLKKVEKKDFFVSRDRICYFDIESDSRSAEGNWDYEDFKIMPILSISDYDNFDDEYHCFVWRPEWKKEVVEHDNYKIVDNIDTTIVHTLRKLFIHKYNNEKDVLLNHANYFGSKRFNLDLGFNSFGGIKVLNHKGKSYRKWFNGYDLNHVFERSKALGLFEDIQVMSPCPTIPKKYTGFEGVYKRSSTTGMGEKKSTKHEIVTKGVGHVDIIYSNETLKFTNKFEQFRGSGLKDYSKFFLKYHKLDKKGKQVWWYWENDIKFMIDYNLIDVKICVDLDKYFNIAKKQRSRTVVPISPFQEALNASKLHDHYKLTHYQDKYSFDSKWQEVKPRALTGKSQITNKFTITLKDLEEQAQVRDPNIKYDNMHQVHKVGGLVIEPKTDRIHKNLIRIDFSKFYPRMIQECNIGIVSGVDVDKEYWFCVLDKRGIVFDRKDLIETPNAFYRKDILSINKELFDKWIATELEGKAKLINYLKEYKTTDTPEYKKLYDDVFNIKGFRNAAFGVLGLEIDRIFSKMGYNSTTISCQDVMMFTLNILREMGYEIIANDTDSAMFLAKSENLRDCEPEGKEVCRILNGKIKEYMKVAYNIDEELISLELEVIADKGYFGGKKHYVLRCVYVDGVWLDKPELEVKGMDLKKRATSKLGADNQINLINCLFDFETPEEGAEKYVKEIDSKLGNLPWTYVCKRGPLRKKLEEYPESNQSATAGRNMLKYFGKLYDSGANPYLGVFSNFPRKIGDRVVDERDYMVLSFEEEDEQMLKDCGFKLHIETIRNTECRAKTEHLLELFQTSWDDLISQSETGGFFML